jgi:cbb3-type cytochrome oxidase subunit 3
VIVLQELAARTGAGGWAIGSMVFFLVIWVFIAFRVVRARREDMEARARLALDDDRDRA